MAETQTYELSEVAQMAQSDMLALSGRTDLDPVLSEVANGLAVPATIRELDKGDVTTVTTPSLDGMEPQERLTALLQSSSDALKDAGLPQPNLENYYGAQAVSAETGIAMTRVMEEYERVTPQEVAVRPAGDGSIDVTSTPDTVGAPEGVEVAKLEGVEPQDYKEYDVHFMMYPLGHDIAGTGIETRPSHGFIVVTEKGVDPTELTSDSPEALIVTRGGPDKGTYDFRLDTDVQSPTENNRDGDLYIKDHDGSAEDLDAGGVRLIETTTITGDIEDIRANVDSFRRAVNSTDINYHAPYQNSNTYAGDVYTNLTGKDAPDTVQWPHYLPGLGNDLPVAGDYSYEQPTHQQDAELDASL